MPHVERSLSRRRIAPDPGWLFVLAGVVLIASAVLIPALDDLARARWQRDRLLAAETSRIQRLDRHARFLIAVQEARPDLVNSLALSQLNRTPPGRVRLEPTRALPDASVLPSLEPDPPPDVPPPPRPASRLERWANDPAKRIWLIAGGGLLLLIGLLPPARARWANHRRTRLSQPEPARPTVHSCPIQTQADHRHRPDALPSVAGTASPTSASSRLSTRTG